MQPKEEIEAAYAATPDPWNYQTNPSDILRKNLINNIARSFGRFKRALDIGCGEGWITQDLPADELFGFEISDTAASRLPDFICRDSSPSTRYDLITATGVFYAHYNTDLFLSIIKQCASHIVIVSSIEAWEIKEVSQIGREVFRGIFPYREFKQRLRVFDVTLSPT